MLLGHKILAQYFLQFCPKRLLLSEFNHNRNLYTSFNKTPHYRIPWNLMLLFSRYCLRTDGRTYGRTQDSKQKDRRVFVIVLFKAQEILRWYLGTVPTTWMRAVDILCRTSISALAGAPIRPPCLRRSTSALTGTRVIRLQTSEEGGAEAQKFAASEIQSRLFCSPVYSIFSVFTELSRLMKFVASWFVYSRFSRLEFVALEWQDN